MISIKTSIKINTISFTEKMYWQMLSLANVQTFKGLTNKMKEPQICCTIITNKFLPYHEWSSTGPICTNKCFMKWDILIRLTADVFSAKSQIHSVKSTVIKVVTTFMANPLECVCSPKNIKIFLCHDTDKNIYVCLARISRTQSTFVMRVRLFRSLLAQH